MIKMFIAGEEVVSNKEFSINEEMLSASSTILNNCYPASWEITKDYVSNFYYPKDYSKFILASGNFDYGDSEFSVLKASGTNPTFETNVEKEINGLNVYGNTTQKTYKSKNLLNNVAAGKTQNNVTFTINDDKSVDITSTGATANTFLRLEENIYLEPGHYYLNGGYATSLTFINMTITHSDSTTLNVAVSSSGYKGFDIIAGDVISFVQVRVGSGYSGSFTFYPAITKDQIETYEPYKLIPSPDYSSELVSVGYQNIFNKAQAADYSTGASEEELDNGIRIVCNSNGNYRYCGIVIGKDELLGKMLTLNGNISASALNEGLLRIWFGNSTTPAVSPISQNLSTSGSTTFTIPNTFANNTDRIYLLAYGNVAGTGTIGDYVDYTNLQITESDKQLEYIPYGKYGIEVSISSGLESNKQFYLLNEPLRAIGDIKDKLYIENGELLVQRNIAVENVLSTDNWSYNATYKAFINQSFADKIKKSTNNNEILALSNNFKGDTANNSIVLSNNYCIGVNTYGYIWFRYNEVSSVANLQTWLSNNNVILQYVLDTPTTENLGSASLLTAYNGNNNAKIEIGGITTTFDINYYWKNYDILFAGIVKNSGDISLNPRYPHYCSLQILDYKTFLSESDTLDFVISKKTIAEAIQMVVNAVSGYGFIVGDIDISQADDIIGAYSTLNKTAYDVLQYLANISGSRWRARFVDSNTMAIDFYDPDTLPQGQDIDYTKEYWEDNNIVDLTFSYGTRDYRNKQVMLSDEVYGSIVYSELLLSNGYSTSYILENNIGVINSVMINGVEMQVITNAEKELGADADFYYTPGKNVLESASSYAAGTQIGVNYIPLVKGRQIVYNNDEIDRIVEQTETTGVIARYESRNDVLSSDELDQIGQAYIEYKGKSEIILTLTTHNKDLYNVGEIVYFNAPIEDLQQRYMVKSKETQYIAIKDDINLFYVYELTSSFNSEKAINYFDNQRNKSTGNIEEGESITRNVDIENTANIIWNNYTITEATITGDNVLNSALNSPFIS